MIDRLPRNLLAILFVFLLLAAWHSPLFADLPPCPPSTALISPTNPAYADAMELKHILESHGFTVSCVFPSKAGSIFEVDEGGALRSTIEGEAAFRTNDGYIGAFFVPKPQTFADFKITEHREDGGYFYTFAGTPRVGIVKKFGSAHRIHFLKHENQLVTSDDKLHARVEQALKSPLQMP